MWWSTFYPVAKCTRVTVSDASASKEDGILLTPFSNIYSRTTPLETPNYLNESERFQRGSGLYC